jgi:hypothetical protein
MIFACTTTMKAYFDYFWNLIGPGTSKGPWNYYADVFYEYKVCFA